MNTDAPSDPVALNAAPESAADSPTPKRPLMRPVNRPTPPASPPAALPVSPTTLPVRPVVTPVAKVEVVAVVPATVPVVPAAEPLGSSRHCPIPPPSEPKQYRAIGLVRGRYAASEEQFTRGEMTTSDGTAVEAVLLGRVMSLVKNHLDLNEEHLWVVYPRTREIEQDLHLQIVGVWEPERLQKVDETEDEDAAAAEDMAEAVAVEPTLQAEDLSPGYDDNYFSIRGEVVFYAPESHKIVVKIQQAPRKAADKAKAFKLQLEGVLETEKAVGYFWDFQVNRTGRSLSVVGATSIGLVPPKKRPPGGFTKGPRRSGPPRDGARFGPPREGVRSGPPRVAAGGSPIRREAGTATGSVSAPSAAGAPKPVKRTAPKPEE